MHDERLFAVVCDANYFPGLQALLNSIHTYHGREIPIHIYVREFDAGQLRWLEGHPLDTRVWLLSDLPLPVLGIWEAKQQVFAHCLGHARCVCLLDADLVLTSRLDDMFELAAEGGIVSPSAGENVVYGPDYAIYRPDLPGMSHANLTTAALCLDVVRHWDLVGLWAFASRYGAYSPGGGPPLKFPGHGDQGMFNALAALLGKAVHFRILPDGIWCDSTKGCNVLIRSRDRSGRLKVWNETEAAPQRLVHSSGPKWWTYEGARYLERFGDKLECFRNFAGNNAVWPPLPPRVEPLGPGTRSVRPKILIGICSCDRFSDRRRAVRETWLSSLPHGIKALFFAGYGNASGEPGLVSLPVHDNYEQLATKVHYFFRYALAYYKFDYLFKCDDDSYVHPERFRKLPRAGVDFLGSTQIAQGYAQGGAGYLMSRAMVEYFVNQPIATDRPEDVFFTERAIDSGMRLESTELLQGYGEQVPEIDNEVVTGHWLGPFEMQRVHAGCTGEYPGPLLLKLRARHDAWSGWIRLYADASFWSQGGASPNGAWAVADDRESLALHWFHWGTELLRLRSWGFEGTPLRLEFVNGEDSEQWQQYLATANATPRQATSAAAG